MSASRKGSTNRDKRNLPVWMSSRSDAGKSHGDEPPDNNSSESNQQGEAPQMERRYDEKAKSTMNETGGEAETVSSGQTTRDFSKLLEGVVLVLSGIVNPERGILRSQALEMGAEYQPDWNSNCTLLVCAFPNTPKFRQVEAQCGTIVSKEWIRECYAQKSLVDIDSYLMHPGKPWRKSGLSEVYNNASASTEVPQSRNIQKQEAQKCLQPEFSSQSKASIPESASSVEEKLSPSEPKRWAEDDLRKTIKWLECQDAKPEPSELRKVAAGGVLTCLQDAIELLEQKQSVQQLKEDWNFLPRVVEELIKLESSAVPNDLVLKQALSFKEIYQEELNCVDDNLTAGKGKHDAYDSDETIEMTEEEIDHAFGSIVSKNHI